MAEFGCARIVQTVSVYFWVLRGALQVVIGFEARWVSEELVYDGDVQLLAALDEQSVPSVRIRK